MDSIRAPSPVPSDGSFVPFATNYSPLTGSLPSATQSLASHSVGAHQRQMAWSSSTSPDSSWSNPSAGNAFVSSSQYHNLLAKFNESRLENASLLTRNTALESKFETLMTAYNMLLSRIPAAASTRNHHTAIRREDYPNVRFWTRQDWNSATQVQALEVDDAVEVFPEIDEEDDGSKEPSPSPGPAHVRGRHRSSQGINVTMKYIELEDGMVVDGFRAAEIRRYARSLWVQMALDKKLPATWSDADATSLATYSESMAQRFIELRLCAADWKANLVATDNYPSWRHNCHLETNAPTTKKPKVLPESGNELLAQLPASIPEKRPKDDLFTMAPIPRINIIPGTPSRPQPAPVPVPSQEGFHVSIPQPTPHYDLNFTIGNPLALNSDAQLTNFTAFHQPLAPVPYHSLAPSTEAFTPAAANLPSTSALPLATANDGPKHLKGTRMRPTKTTTARNLCALEWVKNNPQGTTDEFKAYYNNLSEEQKQVWEEKSKAAS